MAERRYFKAISRISYKDISYVAVDDFGEVHEFIEPHCPYQSYNEGYICIQDDVIIGILTADLIVIHIFKESDYMVLCLIGFDTDNFCYSYPALFICSDVSKFKIPIVCTFENISLNGEVLELTIGYEIRSPSPTLKKRFDPFFA